MNNLFARVFAVSLLLAATGTLLFAALTLIDALSRHGLTIESSLMLAFCPVVILSYIITLHHTLDMWVISKNI